MIRYFWWKARESVRLRYRRGKFIFRFPLRPWKILFQVCWMSIKHFIKTGHSLERTMKILDRRDSRIIKLRQMLVIIEKISHQKKL